MYRAAATLKRCYVELLYSQKQAHTSKVQIVFATAETGQHIVSISMEGMISGDPFANEIWLTDGYGDYVSHY